ncbi:cation transporting ATPase C-terminal domain-containing protein [Pseudomonas sp. S2_H01]
MTILGQGVLLASATLVAFYIALQNDSVAGHDRAVTVAFMTLGLVQILHAFNTRSRHRSLTHQLFTNGWLWAAVMLCVMLQLVAVYQPQMNRVLGTVPLGLSDWWLIIACSLAPVAIVELSKWTRQTLILLRNQRIHPMS